MDLRVAAKALISLVGINLRTLAAQSGTHEDNIRSWLGGNDAALRRESLVAMFAQLGVSKTLISNRVHYWHIESSMGENAKETYGSLAVMSVFLKGMRISPAIKLSMNEEAYLIQGKDATCIQVTLKKGFMHRPAVIENSGASLHEFGGELLNRIKPETLESIREHVLTCYDFEEIFTGKTAGQSWDDVILAARDRQITPRQVLQMIVARDEQLKGHSEPVRLAVDNTSRTEMDFDFPFNVNAK